MRVLRVVALRSATGAYGGPADTALNQAKLIADQGHDVTVLSAIRLPDRPIANPPAIRFVEVPARPMLRKFPLISLFSMRLMSTTWRETKRHDLIHISYSREAIPVWAAISALLQKKRLILQPHGMLTARTSHLHQMIDLAVRRIYRAAHAVIALSEQESVDLRRWNSSAEPAITQIGNPPLPAGEIDGSLRRGDREKRQALFLARLEPRKRVSDFAAAAAIAADLGENVDFCVVGPDQGDLKAIRSKLETVERLSYEGSIPAGDVPQRLTQASVFVLPSRNEPWGNVLATAATMGIPVVVTESAALSALVRKYNAGIVVPDEDPSAIASAVADLLNDADRYETAVDGCIRMSQNHLTADRVGSDLIACYELALRAVLP